MRPIHPSTLASRDGSIKLDSDMSDKAL